MRNRAMAGPGSKKMGGMGMKPPAGRTPMAGKGIGAPPARSAGPMLGRPPPPKPPGMGAGAPPPMPGGAGGPPPAPPPPMGGGGLGGSGGFEEGGSVTTGFAKGGDVKPRHSRSGKAG